MSKVGRWMMERLLARQGHMCPLCGGWLFVDPVHPWHVDHIVSIARGGRHCESNLQVTHGACNLRKGAK